MSELRVAVPADRWAADPATGAGRVWTNVIERLPESGVRVEPVDVHRGRSGRGGLRRRPDVWLVPGDAGALAVPEPLVAVIHGAAWPIEPHFFDYTPRAYAESLISAMEQTLHRTARLIVPSRYTRRGLRDGYDIPEERIHVVAHGVDSRHFKPDGSRHGMRLVAAALGEARPYVLFASLPTIRQKNLSTLRAAMSALAARGLPHALAIAGGPAGGETAEELAAVTAEIPGTHGRVAWLGHLDDEQLSAVMAGCAAFCLPSLFESFGLTALEALACGAPVVVSSAGALPEVVADAALVAEPTAPAMEEALVRVLTEPELAQSMRAAGRRRAAQMTWEKTARGWREALVSASRSG